MSQVEYISVVVMGLSLLGIFSVFLFYPLSVWVVSLFASKDADEAVAELPSVSLVIVLRNGEAIIRQKVENVLSLDYPEDKLQIVFFSDGSTDQTETIIREFSDPRITLLGSVDHIGKAPGINEAVSNGTGEILVLSDADGILDAQAVKMLVRHYGNPKIGGVCGQRIIYKGDHSSIKASQEDYIKFDSKIKRLESSIGSITANDGKLYSIRKALFKPIRPDVTDDLYSCLSVIEQGYRFVFEPEAKAYIRTPSRNPIHEMERRRRVVARSLRGIMYKRVLLNPFKYGFFSVGLFVNKVVRRLLPLCLILLLVASVLLATAVPVIFLFMILQVLFYLTAVVAYGVDSRGWNLGFLGKKLSLVLYFCVGMLGTLRGFIDFISLKRYEKWNPKKVG